jgi:hypothetical protein
MKKALLVAAAALVASFAGEAPTQASDHADGLKTAIDNAADLSDLYTFTSPENPDKVIFVMNVHPFASSRSRFSNAVDYVFRIRPIADATVLQPSDASKEQTISCSFSGGVFLVDAKQHATCVFHLGGAPDTVEFDTRTSDFTAGGSGAKNGLRVFAGARSDTWFVDLSKIIKFNNGVTIAKAAGKNGLQGQNVLSIVVEVDKSRLAGPLLAVAAQTVRK